MRSRIAPLIGLLPIPNLMDRLMAYVSQAMPGDAASIMKWTLREIVRGASGGLLSIGVLGALCAGSTGMSSIMSALNAADDVKETRPWWKTKLLAIGLTLGFFMFILSGLVLLVFGPKLGETVASSVGLGRVFTLVWNIISVPIVMALVAIGIGIVYYMAPSVEQSWRWVTPGSVVAVVLWLAASLGLRWYVTNFANYNATYGSIGGAPWRRRRQGSRLGRLELELAVAEVRRSAVALTDAVDGLRRRARGGGAPATPSRARALRPPPRRVD